MIIELFGPAGVGKTTLAHAACDALNRRGHKARVIASARPSEPGGRGGSSLLAAPCARAIKLPGAIARSLMPRDVHDRVARSMLSKIPPESFVWALRYRRYLARLNASWVEAAACDEIVIFDQGFMSALSSLMVLNGCFELSPFRTALAQAPRADLLVAVDAPQALVASRLERRIAAQSALERLFELDTQTNLQHFETVARLHSELVAGGEAPLVVWLADRDDLRRAAEQVVDEVARVERKRGAIAPLGRIPGRSAPAPARGLGGAQA